MKLMIAALLVLVTAGFTSCASMGMNTDLQKIEASCASAAASLKVLTVAAQNHKLTNAQMEGVLTAADGIEPVCGSPTPPTLDSVKLQAFHEAVAALGGLAASNK